MEAIHTEDYKGYTINIYPDVDPISPREDPYFSKIICWHKRYNLGDRNLKDSYSDLKHCYLKDLTDYCDNWEAVEKVLIKEFKAYIIMPLFLYDHGGISLRTYSHGQYACWDGGYVGFIYVTKEDILKEYNVKTISKKLKEKIIKRLEHEVEAYSDYLNGNVYGYKIVKSKVCEHCQSETEEEFNSCWGFIGDYEYAISEAKSQIDYIVKNQNKETITQ